METIDFVTAFSGDQSIKVIFIDRGWCEKLPPPYIVFEGTVDEFNEGHEDGLKDEVLFATIGDGGDLFIVATYDVREEE